MNKDIYNAALERSGGLYCEYCGSNHMVQLHHILLGNGRRKQCQRIETIIFLCYEHHLDSKTGVHFNKELNAELHKLASDRLKVAGLSGEDLKQALGGRFYWRTL